MVVTSEQNNRDKAEIQHVQAGCQIVVTKSTVVTVTLDPMAINDPLYGLL